MELALSILSRFRVIFACWREKYEFKMLSDPQEWLSGTLVPISRQILPAHVAQP